MTSEVLLIVLLGISDEALDASTVISFINAITNWIFVSLAFRIIGL